MTSDDYKLQAAAQAITFIENGMKLGLGTGSTAAKFIDLLGKKVSEGLDVICVPTSEASRVQAVNLGIKVTTLDELPYLDMTVDGADEVDAELRLIKGGGGALLREKIVAMASGRMVVITDYSKFVETLGAFPLPIEAERFGLRSTLEMISAISEETGQSGEILVREDENGEIFRTDGGNCIIDCHFSRIDEPEELADALATVPGVIETGLFINIADQVIIAGPDGINVLEDMYDEEDFTS